RSKSLNRSCGNEVFFKSLLRNAPNILPSPSIQIFRAGPHVHTVVSLCQTSAPCPFFFRERFCRCFVQTLSVRLFLLTGEMGGACFWHPERLVKLHETADPRRR